MGEDSTSEEEPAEGTAPEPSDPATDDGPDADPEPGDGSDDAGPADRDGSTTGSAPGADAEHDGGSSGSDDREEPTSPDPDDGVTPAADAGADADGPGSGGSDGATEGAPQAEAEADAAADAKAETDAEADADTEGSGAHGEGFATSDGGETIPHYQSIPDVDDPGYATPEPQGPAEDEEMPLTVHIEEMLKRLAIVIGVAGVVSIAAFPYAERVINFLWNSILPQGPTTRPRLYGILELTFTELKVASLAGLIIALPVLVYQTYQFMRPGLYPHERRYYLAAVPTSLVLALVGVSFAYFLFLPLLFGYFLGYSREVAEIGFALGKTFDLILLMMGYLAIVFQIPLFIMLAMMMGLVTREWLAERRLLFWGAFLGIAFFIGVGDPTGAAPFLVAVTMILLFEGTLLLSKWTDRGRRADWA